MGDTEIKFDNVSSFDNPTTYTYVDVNDIVVSYTAPATIIVGNEKIYYTSINVLTNTISGIKRDQAGVGAYQVQPAGTKAYLTSMSSTTNGTWYNIDVGNSNPSDGIPLQNATTPQAVFIREHGVVLPR
jgi:hypothetical protein